MLKPRTSRSGLLLAMLVALSGCASSRASADRVPKFWQPARRRCGAFRGRTGKHPPRG